MIAKGYILVMMVPIIFFVPGVYATSMSIWGGGCGNNFHDSTTLNAPEPVSVFVHSVVQGGTLTQDASGSGDLHKSYVANNGNGEIASITSDVYKAGQWSYFIQPVSTTDATSAKVDGSDYGLTAINARKIECTVGASNRLGDKASADIEVNGGSLINWRGLASANLLGAEAWQAFDKASGKGIEMIGTSSSNNEKDWADSSMTIEEGSISASVATGKRIVFASSSSNAEKDRAKTWIEVEGTNKHLGTITMFNNGASASPTEVSATQTIGTASGKEIELGASSSNKERDKAKTWLEVEGTKKHYGSISDYSSTASATTTTASAQLSNTSPNSAANGKRIVFASLGSNAERERAKTWIEVEGTNKQYGSITNFNNDALASKTGVSATQTIGTASGKEIELGASSSNKERDKAKTWLEVEDTKKHYGSISDSISDYSSTASTTTTTASAQLSNTSPNSAANGKRIAFASSGSDAAGDKTSAYTNVKYGVINGVLTNFANVNTATNTLISSQNANDLSGTMIGVQAKAKSNGAKAHKENKLLNPTNSAFHNNANVVSGTPNVDQGFP